MAVWSWKVHHQYSFGLLWIILVVMPQFHADWSRKRRVETNNMGEGVTQGPHTQSPGSIAIKVPWAKDHFVRWMLLYAHFGNERENYDGALIDPSFYSLMRNVTLSLLYRYVSSRNCVLQAQSFLNRYLRRTSAWRNANPTSGTSGLFNMTFFAQNTSRPGSIGAGALRFALCRRYFSQCCLSLLPRPHFATAWPRFRLTTPLLSSFHYVLTTCLRCEAAVHRAFNAVCRFCVPWSGLPLRWGQQSRYWRYVGNTIAQRD